MSAIAYPSELPCPVTAPIQSKERRILSGLPGPRQSRVGQRDQLATQELSFVFPTFEDVQTFQDWFDSDLTLGGAWFASDWPIPRGGTAVRRFIGAPVWSEFLPKVGWRMQATVEVRGRGELPQTSILSLHPELLIHFDELFPLQWKDSSVNRWGLTMANGTPTSSLASNSAGAFGLCANVQQLAPGGREEIYYNTQARVTVEGNHNLAGEDFFIAFWADLQGLVPPVGWTYNICDAQCAHTGGWFMDFINLGGTTSFRWSCVLSVGDEVQGTNTSQIPIDGLHHYAVSRKDQRLSIFIDGQIEASDLKFSPGDSIKNVSGNIFRMFAINLSGFGEPVHLSDGFQGLCDEFVIYIGSGTGVDSSFPLPTSPYSS